MSDDRESVVYFVSAGDHIKIGVTKDVRGRIRSLQTGCATPLRLLGYVPGDVELERSFHQRFSIVRRTGEWFANAEEIHQFLNELDLHGILQGREDVPSDKKETVNSILIKTIRKIFRRKPVPNLAVWLNLSIKTARNRLEGAREFSLDEFGRLVGSDHGFEILAGIMRSAPRKPDWWIKFSGIHADVFGPLERTGNRHPRGVCATGGDR